MIRATLYHRPSGAVLGHIGCADPADLVAYESADKAVMLGDVDAATQYVIDGSPSVIAVRTPVTLTVSPAAPVVGDVVTVSGLPVPCWVRYGDTLQQLNAGSVQFTPDEGEQHASLVGAYVGSVTVTVRGTTQGALDSDARWAAVRTATPAQIETWLTNNVTNLVQAREVLKVLILAVRKLGA